MCAIKQIALTLTIGAMLAVPTADAKSIHKNNVRSLTVPKAFRVIAHECKVPAKHLYAIALTETETKLQNGHSSPWVWTINYKGKSFFYPDRISLYTAAAKLISNRHLLFDIGIMQVNWRWHKNRVRSLWALTSPDINIRVACDILKDGYRARGNWIEAAGYYHSPSNNSDTRRYISRYKKKLKAIHY
ncbi:transglycosylase SLT domain-containing protein [Photobacterium damselae]|uniref:transglycosylase SLT domain-containing protein n=1 Tax=Photobacterium damselae TaxID=38293 RepID=UPI004068B005